MVAIILGTKDESPKGKEKILAAHKIVCPPYALFGGQRRIIFVLIKKLKT